MPIMNFSTIIVLISFVLDGTLVHAIPARPTPFEVSQPDGREFQLYSKGNAFVNWLEDEKGYVVVKNEGDYFYAEGKNSEGKLIPSAHKVGETEPDILELDMGLRPRAKIASNGHDGQRRKMMGEKNRRLDAVVGTVKNLVIPILFNDHQARTLPSRDDLSLLWNAPGGHPTWYGVTDMSIRDFYLENSYNQLDIESTILDWVLVSGDEAYYGAGESGGTSELMELLNEVLDAVDSVVDFSEFDEDGDGYIDAIAFVHSGYGAEFGGTDTYGTPQEDRIWSHKWELLDPATYSSDPWTSNEGVMVYAYHMETSLYGRSKSRISPIVVSVHETGHFLGLPDLYDTDGSGSGIGSWGVMANSWGWDGTGAVPPSFCVWSKYMLGWLQPATITGAGTYALSDVNTNPVAYIISDPYPEGEYLLIENRQAILSDRQAPASGLLIWHIDEQAYSSNAGEGYPGMEGWPETGQHYMVALLQADGSFDLEMGYGGDEGDVFKDSDDFLHNSPSTHPSSMAYQYGMVMSVGLEIGDVSASGSGNSFNFTVYDSPLFNSSYTAFECNDLLHAELYDSWGDGWNGLLFGLYSYPDSDHLQTVTMGSGSYDEVCLNVEVNSCYYFDPISQGSWPSESSWALCEAEGGSTDVLYFCLDANGTCSQVDQCDGEVTLTMMDSWGDGWNGYEFGLYDTDENLLQTVTLDDGSYGTACLDVDPNSCYVFEVSTAGSWESELSFEICGETGTYMTSMTFCTDETGACYMPDCDLELVQYDSWGDGWNGNYFSLYSADDPSTALQTVTLLDGYDGSVCLDVDVNSCYTFGLSTIGTWQAEISWNLCGVTGDVDTNIAFCIDENGSCNADNAAITVSYPNGDTTYSPGDLLFISWESFGLSASSFVTVVLKKGLNSVQVFESVLVGVGEITDTLDYSLTAGSDYWVEVSAEGVAGASAYFTIEEVLTLCVSDDECTAFGKLCICPDVSSRKLRTGSKEHGSSRKLAFGSSVECYCM
mmetsp:Transcript_29879/g.38404  ORF Transcript_29879/g.38404 Transcript_29879/m.38404 type:complete len:997 (-) Transcript_29879:290-3280(-)